MGQPLYVVIGMAGAVQELYTSRSADAASCATVMSRVMPAVAVSPLWAW